MKIQIQLSGTAWSRRHASALPRSKIQIQIQIQITGTDENTNTNIWDSLVSTARYPLAQCSVMSSSKIAFFMVWMDRHK